MSDKLRVIMVEPEKKPQVVELGSGIKDLQDAVGGTIQIVYPYVDKVGLLLNDEGKLIGMQPNRALKDQDGEIYDIIVGTFYVVGLGEEDLCSLSDELIDKYMKEFEQPYLYLNLGMGVLEIPICKDDSNVKGKKEETIKHSKGITHDAL